MSSVIRILVLCLVLVPAASQASSVDAAVDVVNFAFQDATTGAPVTLAAGPVTWTDRSGFHTVTADDGSFDSGTMRPGDTFTWELPSGVHTYACRFHPSMRGVVVAG